MINIEAIIIANGSAVIMLLMLLFNARKILQTHLPDNAMFYIMVHCAMLLCFVETFSFFIDGVTLPLFHEFSLVINSLLYILNMVFSFVWVLYADYKVHNDTERLKRTYRFIAIPALIIVAGCIINLFVPVFYTISASNVYDRTTLNPLTYLVSYSYLAYGIIQIYRNQKKGSRNLFLPAVLFLLPIMLGSILQFLFYGLSFMWLGLAISLVSLYINVQNQVSYNDPLSGVFNRQYMSKYLEAEIRRGSQKRLLAGIMLDIDRFKSINDRFGHVVGDDAIHSVGTILHSCAFVNSAIFRYAGDEFVILTRVDSVDDVTEIMKQVVLKTEEFNITGKKQYSITFSMGYSIYNGSDDSVDAFINRMDTAMYENKISKTKQPLAVSD